MWIKGKALAQLTNEVKEMWVRGKSNLPARLQIALLYVNCELQKLK